MNVCRICTAILWTIIVAGCNALPVTSDFAPQNGTAQAISSQSADPTSSGNSALPINTLDVSETTPLPPDANPFVKLALEDLAERLQIDPGEIQFLKITDIDWQDITQGCTSTPGQTLTKGRVTGYRIWLAANGKNYLYHVGLDQTLFLCPE